MAGLESGDALFAKAIMFANEAGEVAGISNRVDAYSRVADVYTRLADLAYRREASKR